MVIDPKGPEVIPANKVLCPFTFGERLRLLYEMACQSTLNGGRSIYTPDVLNAAGVCHADRCGFTGCARSAAARGVPIQGTEKVEAVQ